MPPLLLHVDGVAGISGDMTLGALVALGVPVEQLRAGLATLPLSGWTLDSQGVVIRGFAATRARVTVEDASGAPSGAHAAHGRHSHHGHDHDHDHGHDHAHHHHDHPHGSGGRTFAEICHLIERSDLPARVKSSAVRIFRRLCEAEAAVHGSSLETAHLHEAGAIDALIDVCGSCLGLEILGWPEVSASPPDIGGGSVRCAHGLLPIPAPAAAKLLEGLPTTSSGLERELVTPTGAALLATLVTRWGTRPPMRVLRSGFGAGTQDLPDRANVVRFSLGEALETETRTDGAAGGDAGARVVIEADVDDADPQLLAAFCERAREMGASDVTQSSVLMKKGRVGTRIGITCSPAAREGLIAALLAETTTIGCRWHEVQRAECDRSVVMVDTPHGPIRVKVAHWNGRIVNRKPEHDDCVAAARRLGLPLKDIVAAAMAAAATEDTAP